MSAFLLINYVCLNVLVRIVSGVDVYICVLKSMCSGLGLGASWSFCGVKVSRRLPLVVLIKTATAIKREARWWW